MTGRGKLAETTLKPIMTSKAATQSLPVQDPVEALISSIRIPPRPSLLAELQQELSARDPAPRKIAKIIANDVGISGALLKLANSPFFGLKQKAKSVEQAITFLGIVQCASLVTSLLARQAVSAPGVALDRFWDISTKRAQAMVYLSRKLRICPPDIAHTFGLFCDIGVPLLMNRFPDYTATFAAAGNDAANPFTMLEELKHNTNHASIGCLLARNWGLSNEVSLAILLHHDYRVMDDGVTEDAVRVLIALSLLAESGIEQYQGQRISAEWEKGRDPVCHYLGLADDEAADLLEELHQMFDEEH